MNKAGAMEDHWLTQFLIGHGRVGVYYACSPKSTSTTRHLPRETITQSYTSNAVASHPGKSTHGPQILAGTIHFLFLSCISRSPYLFTQYSSVHHHRASDSSCSDTRMIRPVTTPRRCDHRRGMARVKQCKGID